MMTSSLAPACRTPTAVRLPLRTAMRAPAERPRTVVRLVPCVWFIAALPPPEEPPLAALPLPRCPLLPCWLMPELPCWLPEPPCCFAPVLEPDCEPESCACASWRGPVAGSAATGAATARTAAAPEHHCEYSHFFLLRRASPQDNPAAEVQFPRAAKII